jgi:hypothetical protein
MKRIRPVRLKGLRRTVKPLLAGKDHKEKALKRIRKRLTYANVMSSIAVFLVIGGASAVAASQLAKNSVGKKQLKNGAVTTAKLKKNAVTAAKIKDNAVTAGKIKDNAVTGTKLQDGSVTGAKVLDGSLTGADINAATLATVPNSATTNVIKAAHGTLALGQEATVFTYGPLSISVKCEVPPQETNAITARAYISSSSENSVFTSWEDGSSKLGPGTPSEERELNNWYWADSDGPFGYDSASDIGVSATAANGQSFTAYLGLASEKDTSTCWYWLNATILG